MVHTDIPLSDAITLRDLVTARQVSPVEVVEAALAQVAEQDPKFNVFVTVTEKLAREAAKAAEHAVMSGRDLGPLSGIPLTVKDNLDVKGFPTTFGSIVQRDNVAASDSAVVERAKAAGGCILGKTTTPEFAAKAVGDSPLTGVTRNPWDPTKTPGGSSAGGAAGVAAGIAPLALVTDGGGSTRNPASFCGVFGLKPQFGRIPHVPIAATPSLSHVGILSHHARDAALLLGSVSGGDLRDPASIPSAPVSLADRLDAGPRGVRVAWSRDLGYAKPRPEIARAVEDAVNVLENELGYSVDTQNAVLAEDPLPVFKAEFLAGAAAKLGGLLAEHRAAMDPAVALMLSEGLERQTLAEYMARAGERYELRERVRQLFDRYDLLITPTLPVTAFDVGRNVPPGRPYVSEDDILGWQYYTQLFNLTGNPAASVPCGLDESGMPIGMQIVGRAYQEQMVLRAAMDLERLRPWSRN